MLQSYLRHPSLSGLSFLLRLGEPVLFLICSGVAFIIRNGYTEEYVSSLSITLIATFLFAFVAGTLKLYESNALRSLLVSVPRLFVAIVSTFGIILTIFFLLKASEGFSRIWMMLWFVLSFASIVGIRWWVMEIISSRVKEGRWKRKIAILGTGPKALSLTQMIATSGHEDMAVVGVYGLTTGTEGNITQIGDESFSCSYGGNFTALMRQAQMGLIDDIIIAEDLDNLGLAQKILNKLNTLVVNVLYCLPMSLAGRTGGIGGLPLVLVYRKPLEVHSVWLKRSLDIMASGGMLLVAAPIMLGVALIIKATSPGPVFFRQQRGGFNGSTFEMLKFRSMRTGAAAQLDEEGKEMQAGKHDARITPIGRFIRRSSLDELPQLLNVLRGDMSLVGPRPHVPSHNSYYGNLIDAYASRHKMKPGLTGWAQLNGWRGETETIEKMAKRVEYDIWYTENWSLWLDIKIIVLTPFVTLFQKGAY